MFYVRFPLAIHVTTYICPGGWQWYPRDQDNFIRLCHPWISRWSDTLHQVGWSRPFGCFRIVSWQRGSAFKSTHCGAACVLMLLNPGPFVHIASCIGNIVSRWSVKYETNEGKLSSSIFNVIFSLDASQAERDSQRSMRRWRCCRFWCSYWRDVVQPRGGVLFLPCESDVAQVITLSPEWFDLASKHFLVSSAQ